MKREKTKAGKKRADGAEREGGWRRQEGHQRRSSGTDGEISRRASHLRGIMTASASRAASV